jgi:hypothetical protein
MSTSNHSTTTSYSYDHTLPFTHPAYILEGVLMCVSNCLIVGAVAKCKSLNERKVCLGHRFYIFIKSFLHFLGIHYHRCTCIGWCSFGCWFYRRRYMENDCCVEVSVWWGINMKQHEFEHIVQCLFWVFSLGVQL